MDRQSRLLDRQSRLMERQNRLGGKVPLFLFIRKRPGKGGAGLRL